jgi:hypothetical protein
MGAAAQAHAFYRQVAETGKLWMLCGPSGGAATIQSGNDRVMPLWSSKSRIEKIIANVDGYSRNGILETTWSRFKRDWVPVLVEEGVLVGVNWAGPSASGYEMQVEMLVRAVAERKHGAG